MAYRKYTVKQAECISSIAFKYGFFSDTIWNDSKNSELKQKRKDPDVLLPDDVVYIPDLREGVYEVAPEVKHTFRRQSVPAKFKLLLLDGDDPRPDLAYQFEVDGELRKGKTNGEGVLEEFIPPNASRARLIIDHAEEDRDPEEYVLRFGGLAPVSEESGVRQRLENLSYLRANADKDELNVAVMNFKEDHCDLEIKRDGTATTSEIEEYKRINQTTRDKLVEVHGS